MNKNGIDIREILDLIPHRYPFVLIDKVVDFKRNECIVGIKNVSFNEHQFIGHFPDNPIMPGVLTIEASAQLAAVLMAKSTIVSLKSKVLYLTSIDSANFHKVITPGDVMYIYVRILKYKMNVYKFMSQIKVCDSIVAEARFTTCVK